MVQFNCQVCNCEYDTQRKLINHIKAVHTEYTYETYIVKYFFDGEVPKCKCGCGTAMKFFSYEPSFFNDYAKNHFPRNKHTEETKKKIGEGGRKTFNEKYGVDNPMQIPEFIENIAKTKMERYGDPIYWNPEKSKATFKERYGDEKYRNTEQMVETNLKKYGAKTFTSTPEGIAQIKKTKYENFGDENYCNVDQMRQTKKKRYGYECEFADAAYRKKYNGKTSLVEHYVADSIGGTLKFYFGGKEYDIIKDDYVIEVDGDYYHPISLTDIRLDQIGTITNDYIKTVLLEATKYKLLKILASKIGPTRKRNPITFEFLLENSHVQNFEFDVNTIIISRETIVNAHQKYDLLKLESKIASLLKFVEVCYPICKYNE